MGPVHAKVTGTALMTFFHPAQSRGEAALSCSWMSQPQRSSLLWGRDSTGPSLFPFHIPVSEASQDALKVGSFIPADSVQDSSCNGNFSMLTPIVSIFSPDLERPSFLGLSCDSDSLLAEQRLPTVPNHS